MSPFLEFIKRSKKDGSSEEDVSEDISRETKEEEEKGVGDRKLQDHGEIYDYCGSDENWDF